jgi:hypothetical protein
VKHLETENLTDWSKDLHWYLQKVKHLAMRLQSYSEKSKPTNLEKNSGLNCSTGLKMANLKLKSLVWH